MSQSNITNTVNYKENVPQTFRVTTALYNLYQVKQQVQKSFLFSGSLTTAFYMLIKVQCFGGKVS